eukprot:CAMPEP_0119316954 /NCGR_PEP_ID=MMETSP1333-20130426/41468_1 /TAXON_ID=418940 /ORGANISM="Scyphosphaera apsteinii, Strain RCC1455" /LENGTH=391 /DNA_ID=CAMNT_0007322743 /DNA_START=126 /DNA_END=1301 /DNA_ORIENTATION=-
MKDSSFELRRNSEMVDTPATPAVMADDTGKEVKDGAMHSVGYAKQRIIQQKGSQGQQMKKEMQSEQLQQEKPSKRQLRQMVRHVLQRLSINNELFRRKDRRARQGWRNPVGAHSFTSGMPPWERHGKGKEQKQSTKEAANAESKERCNEEVKKDSSQRAEEPMWVQPHRQPGRLSRRLSFIRGEEQANDETVKYEGKMYVDTSNQQKDDGKEEKNEGQLSRQLSDERPERLRVQPHGKTRRLSRRLSFIRGEVCVASGIADQPREVQRQEQDCQRLERQEEKVHVTDQAVELELFAVTANAVTARLKAPCSSRWRVPFEKAKSADCIMNGEKQAKSADCSMNGEKQADANDTEATALESPYCDINYELMHRRAKIEEENDPWLNPDLSTLR